VIDAPVGEGAPLLSIIIPTRERCEFLVSCVRSALACTDPAIEVVVSDNASADGTKAALGAFADARLVYVNPGERVAMHDNFEFALSRSRGRYLMFIGDDDAVLPDRIMHLLELLRSEQPEVVNWEVPGYVWPGGANGTDGILTLKPSYLRGGRSVRDSRALLHGLADGSRASYRLGGAKIYHGCVARHVVDAVIARAGRYFFVPWPDVGAAIANLFVTDDIIVLGQPCTLGGESRASSGWSLRFQEKQQREPANPFAEFIDENLKRSQTATVDARIRTISALTFLTLAESIRRMATAPDLRINDRAWMPILESELATMPEPARSEQSDIVDSGLQTIGLPRLDRAWLRKQRHKRARIRPPMRSSRLLPNRLSIVSRPGLCSNVYEAALATDRILGSAPEVTSRGRLALAATWLGALARAGRVIVGGPGVSKRSAPLHQEADGRA
jgi:glycosyltransferase involved in cell wall biosynthesis